MPYWRLSGFYFFYFATVGALVPYWGLYLQSIGFTPLDIGLLMSLLMISRGAEHLGLDCRSPRSTHGGGEARRIFSGRCFYRGLFRQGLLVARRRHADVQFFLERLLADAGGGNPLAKPEAIDRVVR